MITKKEESNKKDSSQTITLQQLDKKVFTVNIRGITPLLMEKMDMTVVENIDKKKSLKTVEKDTRSEEDKVEDKIHRNSLGQVAFPSIAFHKAITEVAPYLDGMDKKKVRGSIRFIDEMIPISFKTQTTNKTCGKSSGITKSPRLIIRPQFNDWTCSLKIMYNNANISAENIINLINWAGFQMGIGGWRPEKSGNFGQFEVVVNK